MEDGPQGEGGGGADGHKKSTMSKDVFLGEIFLKAFFFFSLFFWHYHLLSLFFSHD